MQVRWRWLGALLLLFLLMLMLGAIPGEANALSQQFGDKTLHLAAYTVLGLLCYRSWVARWRQRAALTVWVIALLGLIDESIQATLPYRSASLLDWCFDLLAALIAILTLSLLEPLITTRGAAEQHAGRSEAERPHG